MWKDTRELPGTHFQIACWRWSWELTTKGKSDPGEESLIRGVLFAIRQSQKKKKKNRVTRMHLRRSRKAILLRQEGWALRRYLIWKGDLGWGRRYCLSGSTPTGSVDGSRGDLSLFNGTCLLPQRQEIFVWGWNESGQLALPTKSLAEDGKTTAGEGEGRFC